MTTSEKWGWFAAFVAPIAIAIIIPNLSSIVGLIHWIFTEKSSNAPVGVQLITSATTIAIALLAIYFASWTAHRVARIKATIDLIEKRESTIVYRDCNATFSHLRRGSGFRHLNNPSPDDQDKREQVKDYLNHYELVALGIRKRVLDDDFYRGWMGGPFVRDWNAAGDWIQRERWKRNEAGDWEYDDNIFEHFEFIATRWSRKARRLKAEPRTPPKDGGAGPGDEALPVLGDQPADVAVTAASPHPPLYGVRRHSPFVSFFTPKG